MNAKHTPGPWLVSVSGPTVYALHQHPQRNRFDATPQAGRRDDASKDELMANAVLMAASPFMLGALEQIARNAALYHHSTIREIANEAIAKATGEQL